MCVYKIENNNNREKKTAYKNKEVFVLSLNCLSAFAACVSVMFTQGVHVISQIEKQSWEGISYVCAFVLW